MKTNKLFLFQAKVSHRESKQTLADVQKTSVFNFPVTESLERWCCVPGFLYKDILSHCNQFEKIGKTWTPVPGEQED